MFDNANTLMGIYKVKDKTKVIGWKDRDEKENGLN